MSKSNSQFIHHVYFWLKNAGNATDTVALIEGLQKLSEVPTIKTFNIGTPASTRRDVIDSSYAASWLCHFDSPEAQDIYQTHPIHLKFVETCSHLWERVIVYDSISV